MVIRRVGGLFVAASLCLSGVTVNALQADQKPLDPADEAIFNPNDNNFVTDNGVQKAKIVLYPGSRTYPDDLRDMGIPLPACSDKSKTKVVELAADVCLSGEYYLRDNIKILERPSCPDGSDPTLQFYPNRRCTGSPQKTVQNADDTTGKCLWSGEDISIPTYYWSMIYRCNSEADSVVSHQEASPALVYQNVFGAPGAVRHHHGTTFLCHSDFANRTHTTDLVPGNCHWPLSHWRLETIEIVSPAVCNNGTRAQLVIYEDIGKTGLNYMCNWGAMTFEKAIMDVDDWMLNTCINMHHVKLLRGGFGRALGVMFHCDGIHFKRGPKKEKVEEVAKKPLPRGPKISHRECATSSGRWQWADPVRPKTFMYPKPNRCVTLPEAHQLRIHEKPTCPDGTTGRLATWQDPGCVGWPKRVQGVDTLNCEYWNLRSESSYMIWCGPEGLTADERKEKPEDDRAVLSVDECPRLNMKPGWTVITNGVTNRRVDSDKECVSIYKDNQLKLYKNAKCPSGKDAKVVRYSSSSCYGEPDGFLKPSSLIDTCTQICREGTWSSCGIKFVCDN